MTDYQYVVAVHADENRGHKRRGHQQGISFCLLLISDSLVMPQTALEVIKETNLRSELMHKTVAGFNFQTPL